MDIQLNFDHINPTLILGVENRFLKHLEKSFPVELICRGSEISCKGDKDVVLRLQACFNELIEHIEREQDLSESDLLTYIRLHQEKTDGDKTTLSLSDVILHSSQGPIRPRNENQAKLYDRIRKNDIIFSIGPAGTGKTYLAVAIAVSLLKSQRVKKIILARPVVQAGEDLGYLPGDFKTKVNPYLRPLLDALEDFFDREQLQKYLEQESIEIAPLAYMRGRTLNNAFVILDEAQNTTNGQMKMFLTRLGKSSKAIITGDVTQIDLPKREMSGLLKIQTLLKNIKGIDFIYFTKSDVVRHRLVQEIINAYENEAL